jgi:hypothetical protein
MLVVFLIPFDDESFRRGGLINEVVLPFVWFALITNWRIDRCITEETSMHVNNVLGRDIKALRDQRYLIGV